MVFLTACAGKGQGKQASLKLHVTALAKGGMLTVDSTGQVCVVLSVMRCDETGVYCVVMCCAVPGVCCAVLCVMCCVMCDVM